jgi:RP/EB family microtubule-associated protein
MRGFSSARQTVASRSELLDWLNALLGIHYTKVEETSNGAAFCQILDALYPNKVKLHKVNFNAITEVEMIANYKIMQEVFNFALIPRNIPIETLIKGRCQAALEMLQWMKIHFDQTFTGGAYDGPRRRQEAGIRYREDAPQTKKKPASRPVARNRPANAVPARQVKAPPASAARPKRPQVPVTKQIQTLKEELEKAKQDNISLIDERNFYYDKLQQVEAVFLSRDKDELTSTVLRILYQTDDDYRFVSPDELDI